MPTDHPDWPTERLRQLDAAVAEAEGWTGLRMDSFWKREDGSPDGPEFLQGHDPARAESNPTSALGPPACAWKFISAGQPNPNFDSSRLRWRVPRYSLGEGLWPLIRRERITTVAISGGRWAAYPEGYDFHQEDYDDTPQMSAPTPEIAVCLALLAKAGKPVAEWLAAQKEG